MSERSTSTSFSVGRGQAARYSPFAGRGEEPTSLAEEEPSARSLSSDSPGQHRPWTNKPSILSPGSANERSGSSSVCRGSEMTQLHLMSPHRGLRVVLLNRVNPLLLLVMTIHVAKNPSPTFHHLNIRTHHRLHLLLPG